MISKVVLMKTKNMVVPFLLLASACSGGDPVDIGDDSHTARTGERLSDYAATWTGYVEAGGFPSGSDRISMTIDENGQGTIVFGEGVPPGPATDPTDSYPEPGLPLASGFSAPLVEGYPYAVIGALVEAKRLRLGAELNEVMKGWCELQTSYWNEALQAYACVPDDFAMGGGQRDGVCFIGDPDDPNNRLELPCFQVMACEFSQTCSCNETGCTIETPTSYQSCDYQLDAALEDEGETLDGTLMGQRVRMERQ
jgi:hypothetical protein